LKALDGSGLGISKSGSGTKSSHKPWGQSSFTSGSRITLSPSF
jgi:hypothetical protein